MSAAKVMPGSLLDPTEILRPEPIHAGKPIALFRDFTIDTNDPIKERVRLHYDNMHRHQTVEFVLEQHERWLKFDKLQATIMEALETLSTMLDQSDPDVDFPNMLHAFQTAERIRQDHPDCEWFQLTGLLHDMGKILVMYGEPQWAVTGDTFPVGCAWADSIVYKDSTFLDNPDTYNPKYKWADLLPKRRLKGGSTKYGIYSPHCGLDNVLMAWGHDEYMYRALKHNDSKLPEVAHKIIRFHSFYPWHSAGDYMHLCNEDDMEVLTWVLEFNKYDLYTKCDRIPDLDEVMPYYQRLIDKYIPGVLNW